MSSISIHVIDRLKITVNGLNSEDIWRNPETGESFNSREEAAVIALEITDKDHDKIAYVVSPGGGTAEESVVFMYGECFRKADTMLLHWATFTDAKTKQSKYFAKFDGDYPPGRPRPKRRKHR